MRHLLKPGCYVAVMTGDGGVTEKGVKGKRKGKALDSIDSLLVRPSHRILQRFSCII
jgi:hypothetical protein